SCAGAASRSPTACRARSCGAAVPLWWPMRRRTGGSASRRSAGGGCDRGWGVGVIGPGVWTPRAANGRPAGSLCLARTRGAAPFSQSEIDLALLFAAHAGVILEGDQGRDDAERVSVLHDQERIARDLH